MIKIIIIAILGITTLGLLGATIGLGVTHGGSNNSKNDTAVVPEVPLCNDVPGYVNAFLDIEQLTGDYIDFTTANDTTAFNAMMLGGNEFDDGKASFDTQYTILTGAISATNQLGAACRDPGVVYSYITARQKFAKDYSTMTYKEYLESRGIYTN